MQTLKEIYDSICPQEIALQPQIAYRLSLTRKNGRIQGYTDKNGLHCYIDYIYSQIFDAKRHTATKLLEIGVWTGASLVLWRDYFTKAHIYGIDDQIPQIMELIFEDRITQIAVDAYSHHAVSAFKDNEFDIIIEDGPHTLDSMVFCLTNYLSKLKSDGIFVIEDIPEISWIDKFFDSLSPEYHKYAKVYDLTEIMSVRWPSKPIKDDIVFVLDMSKS